MARGMLLDDVHAVREAIADILMISGNNLSCPSSIADALTQLAQGDDFDFMILRAKETEDFIANLGRFQEVCPTLPIIAVSSASSIDEVIAIFQAGAIDYLSDISAIDENRLLLSVNKALDWRNKKLQRMRTVQQISKGLQALLGDTDLSETIQPITTQSQSNKVVQLLHIRELAIDAATHTVSFRGQPIDLSPTEFLILSTLAEANGNVVSYEAFAAQIYHNHTDRPSARKTLSTHFSNLRAKLRDAGCEHYLLNKWGIGYAFDINAEAALRRMETRFRLIAEHTPDVIVFGSMDGEIHFLSPSFETLLGYDAEKMMASGAAFWLELIHSDDHASFVEFVQARSQSSSFSNYRHTYRWRHAAGHYLWFETYINIIESADYASEFVAICRDVTERKRSEEALRRSEAFYRILVRSLPDTALLIFDPDLRYMVAEGASLELQGYNRELVEGKTIWEVLPAEKAEALAPYYRAALAGKSISFSWESNGKSYTVQAVPIYTEDNIITAGMLVIRDVASQKEWTPPF